MTSTSVLIILILCFVFALLFGNFMIPLSVKTVKRKKVVARDQEKTIPKLGGIMMFLFGFGIFILKDLDLHHFTPTFVPCIMLLFLVGVRDDLMHTKPIFRLFAFLICTSIISFGMNMGETSLFNLKDGNFLFDAGNFLLIFISLAVLSVSFQTMDKIRGVATIFGLITLIFLSIVLWNIKAYYFVGLCVLTIGFLLAFLKFNLTKDFYSVSLGLSGAMFISLIIVLSGLKILYTGNVSFMAFSISKLNIIVLFLATLIIPLFNVWHITIIPIFKLEKECNQDRDDICLMLIRKYGFSNVRICGLMTLLDLMTIALFFILTNFISWEIAVAFMILFYFLFSFYLYKMTNKSLSINRIESEKNEGIKEQ